MSFRFLKKRKPPFYDAGRIPVHIGVIMDGNGRWARKRGLPRSAGHKAGAEKLRNVTEWCGNLGIKYLTVYAFSTENWSRPSEEVSGLMSLLIEFLEKYEPEMAIQGVRLRVLGDMDSLPDNIRRALDNAVQRSVNRQKMQLIIAFNYGGRREIAHAARKISEMITQGTITPADVSEDLISDNLYLPDIPDPDMIIRPSGELRLSNFLLWESAYSELWFSDVLWPDFSEEHLRKALEDYIHRDRRYGGVKS
ncbi:MAG: isoprenyl transferase [Eubacteriales bacterium]|nr:isoprenyl transferase [Eubacteriales bacterium]